VFWWSLNIVYVPRLLLLSLVHEELHNPAPGQEHMLNRVLSSVQCTNYKSEVAEFIDPVFAKNKPKTGSINSGTVILGQWKQNH
jgi:hypothetical protein